MLPYIKIIAYCAVGWLWVWLTILVIIAGIQTVKQWKEVTKNG